MKKLVLLLTLLSFAGALVAQPKSKKSARSKKKNTPQIIDMWLGEFIRGEDPAQGWRNDTITGYHKQEYFNPFPEYRQFTKKKSNCGYQFFYFQDGWFYDGELIDSSYTKDVDYKNYIKGQVTRGRLNGRVLFYGGHVADSANYRIEAHFLDGEVVGNWTLRAWNGQVVERRLYEQGHAFPSYAWSNRAGEIIETRFQRDHLMESTKVKYASGQLKESLILERVEDPDNHPSSMSRYYNVIRYYEDGQIKEYGMEKRTHFIEKVGEWKYFDELGNPR
ncbi:MAG: hypothetical protein AAFV80_16885 [Bacteroidota bacterium]